MPREYQSGLMSHPVSPVSSTAVSLALRPTTSDFQPPPPPPPFETLSLATPTPSLFRRFTAPVLPASVLHNLRHPHNYVARDPTRETYTTTSTPTTNSPETETEGWSPSPFESIASCIHNRFFLLPFHLISPFFSRFSNPFLPFANLALCSSLLFEFSLSAFFRVYPHDFDPFLEITKSSSSCSSYIHSSPALNILRFPFLRPISFLFLFFLLSFVRSGRTFLCFESLHNSVSPFSFFLSSFFLRFFTFSP